MDFLTSRGLIIDLNAAELKRCLTPKIPADAIAMIPDALFAEVKEANFISERGALVLRRKMNGEESVKQKLVYICWHSLVAMDSLFCSHVLCFFNVLKKINLVYMCLVVVLLPLCTCVVYARAGV